MAAIAIWFAPRIHDTEEYFVGGRRIAGWVIGLSLVGTSISSITFLAYPADAYRTAWLRYLPNLALPVAVLIAARLFLPHFRRAGTITAYEFLERRYGPSVRVYAALAFIIAQVVRISMILYLLALLVQQVTGLPPLASIVLAGLFVGAYTWAGGIDAVIWTDVIQTVVLVVGGLAALWVVVEALPGGLGQVIEEAMAAGKLAFSELDANGALREVDWSLALDHKTGTMMLLIGLVAWLTEYSANQNTVQRYCAAESDAAARRAMYLCAAASLPIWAFYMFLGSALWVFYRHFPADLPQAILAGAERAEQIFPYFIVNELPAGVAGLVIAAALAAAMSSLDSSLNALSAVSVHDLYRRHLAPDRDEPHYLRMARRITAVCTLLMMAGALLLLYSETRTLQHLATILTSLLGGGLLGIYLTGFLSRLGDSRAVWVGIVLTLAFTGWTLLQKQGWLPQALTLPFDLYYTGLIGNLVMIAGIVMTAILLGTRKKEPSHA
ncbi:MAG: sodium:solute symporter [Gammaproteobacteria bacterium]|nr:MAG: sodium:solute symporter [Gammaproteobacteria bacterium]